MQSDWIERVSKIPVDSSGEEPDLCIIELGGTVGDIESAHLLKLKTIPIQSWKRKLCFDSCFLVPVIHGEQKPSQLKLPSRT